LLCASDDRFDINAQVVGELKQGGLVELNYLIPGGAVLLDVWMLGNYATEVVARSDWSFM
jgi:hypothetical protein